MLTCHRLVGFVGGEREYAWELERRHMALGLSCRFPLCLLCHPEFDWRPSLPCSGTSLLRYFGIASLYVVQLWTYGFKVCLFHVADSFWSCLHCQSGHRLVHPSQHTCGINNTNQAFYFLMMDRGVLYNSYYDISPYRCHAFNLCSPSL